VASKLIPWRAKLAAIQIVRVAVQEESIVDGGDDAALAHCRTLAARQSKPTPASAPQPIVPAVTGELSQVDELAEHHRSMPAT
jgi:hypothetical protein